MAELYENLAGLRGLYQDLSAASTSPLCNVDRLVFELDTHIQDFRKLLDKPAKNNKSRQDVLSGKITLCDVTYEVNADFQQGTLQLADALDIDEMEAANMFLAAQEYSQVLDRPPLITAIMRFHERRSFLLECLRLIFHISSSDEIEAEELKIRIQEYVSDILEIKNSNLQNASIYTRTALQAMEDIEKWLSLLAAQVQKASVVEQEEDQDIMEAIEHQRQSLYQQHESLAAILFHLFAGSSTSTEDFRILISQLKKVEKFDGLSVHYIPMAIACFSRFGYADGSGSQKEARSLHTMITNTNKDAQPWKLPFLHAAINALWVSFYSGWYWDDGPSSPAPGVDSEQEAAENTKVFKTALEDGAFDFMLAICSAVNSEEWADPARTELVTLLLRESAVPTPEIESCNDYMKQLLMKEFGVWVEALISNMPDAVRSLKSEEDTQRLDQLTALRDGLTSNLHRGLVEARTHLESLLVIMSFSFEHRQEDAQEFWSDTTSNLYGFIQWASKRQTVPRVSAFCELLCAFSGGEENALAVHRFLTDEDKFMTSKLKRSTAMNWMQMFAELKLYADRVTEKPASGTTNQSGILRNRELKPVDMSEPESPVMLTCYLRLMGHLCKQNGDIRVWMLENQTFPVVDNLLRLCSGPIPTHLRATAFDTLSALMSNKTVTHGNDMWTALDNYFSSEALVSLCLGKLPQKSQAALLQQQALRMIGEHFDQTNALVVLANSLIEPASDLIDSPMPLSFPETLGSTYRMPGIEPYVDFILGNALSRKMELKEHQSRLLTYNCLGFVLVSLRTFNENMVSVLSQPSHSSDSSSQSSKLAAYVRIHPFARVMEWLFNEDVLKALFATSHQDVAEVAQASSDSVMVLTLLRSLEVMNLILDLQSTYFNIVKPLVKVHSVPGKINVANSSLASFEDSVLNHLTLVPALCLYCGTGHQQLTVTAMALLEKLTSSSKLNKMSSPGITKWQSSNKIVEVLASEVDVDSVSRSLVSQMRPEERELEWGAETAGYVIRESLLALLNSCLGMITDRPTVAHLLLGFGSVGNMLDVPSNGLFAQRMSLMHTIIEFLQLYPEHLDGHIQSWTVHIKRIAFEVLKHLWSSKLATYFTLGEMRAQGFLASMFSRQSIVGPSTSWNGFPVMSDEFWATDATSALAEFLLYRSHLFAYAATEIRAAAKTGSPTLQEEILATLLGNIPLDNGESFKSPSVFDLFDFADLDIGCTFELPQLTFLGPVAAKIAANVEEDSPMPFNAAEAEQHIQEEKSRLLASGSSKPHDEDQFNAEASDLILFFLATNQSRLIQHNRYLALRSWAELITTIISCSVIDDSTRPGFILHAIQLILPKLEFSIDQESPEAIELARLAETLISRLTSDLSAIHGSRSGDIVDEKLYQLFQVCMRGIKFSAGNVQLRETLYAICSHYISRITASDSTHGKLQQFSQQAVKACGSSVVEIICDDAYNGQETCRAGALLLLNLLVALDNLTDCVLAETISQSNYLSLFLDSLRSLPAELRNAPAAETPVLLAFYESLLALFQILCQTKNGAIVVLKSGLFESVRESQLFAVDPDIGIDIDDPDSLRKFYDLLLSVIRVIVTAVFSRGIHNEQIKARIRTFLAENRSCMVGVFKRFAKIGGGAPAGHQETLCELVKSFMVLVTATDYLDFEEEQDVQQTVRPALFS